MNVINTISLVPDYIYLAPLVGGNYGPYIQSQRLDIYHKHAETLLHKGHAYRCFCSEDRLAQLRQGATKKGAPTLYDRYCLSLSKDEIQEKLHNKVPHTIRLKV